MTKIELLFITFFGSGYSPVAPGTAGTLATIVFLAPIYLLFPQYIHYIIIALIIAFLYPAIVLSTKAEQYWQKEDPGYVVIDEVLGYFFAVLFLPINIYTLIASFFIFRILDILKPFPAYESQSLPGGWGIVIDDIIVGIYTNLIIRIFQA